MLVKVKVRDGDLKFEPCDGKDQEKLEIAEEEVGKLIQSGDIDIPKEDIPKYEVRRITPVLGIDKWYQLFNPRQLLTLVKLVKLIREAGKLIEQKKIEEGLTREEAFRYAEAVVTYLGIALCKYADWNSIVSGWQLSYLIAAHTLAMRGIAMVWNWGEYNPFSNYRGTWEAMSKNLVNSLSYLVSITSTNNSSGVKILLDDATTLTKLNEKFDLIVTDPPYYDDVPYSELSDFYYVWLKRALSDVKDKC